jgi:APA family basic amino acid/polyamine antiporter
LTRTAELDIQPTGDHGPEFYQGLGLFDAVMLVVGVMIGSGIFIVPAEMARQIGSPGWLMIAWGIAGVLTISGALCFGELSAMLPQAGGMYVYLREAYSPLVGFLYGWTLFTVIQTGSIAAVAVAFARFSGVIWPSISENNYMLRPLPLSPHYAISLSTAQLAGIAVICFLTLTNTGGLRYGKWIQNVFTVAKVGALVALILLGLSIGWNRSAVHSNFGHLWHARGIEPLGHGLNASTPLGVLIALCLSQTGALFSADSWHNIAFAAGEVRRPERNVTLAMVLGTIAVISLYLLANLAYLTTLPLTAIQHAPADRVGTATLRAIFPGAGAGLMAAAIIISTFGTVNALILAGARVYYTMARQGLFFSFGGALNKARVPAASLWIQGIWGSVLVLCRSWNASTGSWGNLYSNLLEYIISAALLFYVLTVLAVVRLRAKRPASARPYRTFGYPVVPVLYVLVAGAILIVLFAFRPTTTWPGLLIVLLGIPVYALLVRLKKRHAIRGLDSEAVNR